MPRPRQTPWREDPVILARLPEVEQRLLAGEPNTAIAAALGVNEITIRRDRQRLHQLWQERTGGKVEALKAEAIAELDDLKRRALRAAEFDEVAERAVLFGEKGPDGKEVHYDEKGSAQFRGNKAGALTVARQCVMDKAKIRGLLVDKVAETDSKGNDLPLSALQERYQRARDREAPADES